MNRNPRTPDNATMKTDLLAQTYLMDECGSASIMYSGTSTVNGDTFLIIKVSFFFWGLK